MIKVITFDLDDTLWHNRPVLMAAECALYRWLTIQCPAVTAMHSIQSLRQFRAEFQRSQPALAHQITESRRAALQTVMEQAGINTLQAARLSREGVAIFLRGRHQVQLYDGVTALLELLSENFVLGALTNGNADVHQLDIGHYFSFALSAEQLDSSKPQPAHFEHAEKLTGARGDEILHIGDHYEHDIAAAQRHGWQTIWLRQTRDTNDHNNTSTLTVTQFAGLPAAIEQITGAKR